MEIQSLTFSVVSFLGGVERIAPKKYMEMAGPEQSSIIIPSEEPEVGGKGSLDGMVGKESVITVNMDNGDNTDNMPLSFFPPPPTIQPNTVQLPLSSTGAERGRAGEEQKQKEREEDEDEATVYYPPSSTPSLDQMTSTLKTELPAHGATGPSPNLTIAPTLASISTLNLSTTLAPTLALASMTASASTEESTFSMNPDDYMVGSVIGFGSSAIVYHTTYKPLNVTVALKMIDLDHFERNQIDELRREIQVMTLCKHSNLLKILASFVHESKLWIVTPYLSGGSCLDIMKSGFREGLEEMAIATILVQALQGLEYLHRNGHIHRDVKAGNLLMDGDGTVQLADFGVSSSLMEEVERRGVRKTFVGTPCWMAPEVMEMTNGYDSKADIWSFGITALELAYGHAPFAKYPPMKVIYLTLSNAPPTLDRKHTKHKYSRVFKEMIDSCLQRDPTKRPTAETLLRHPFFRQAKKKAYLVGAILEKVRPLEERARAGRAKMLEKQPPEHESNTLTEGWDFTTEEECDGIDSDATELMVVEAPISTVTTPTDNSFHDKKSSRFVVETESSKEFAQVQTTPTIENGEITMIPPSFTKQKEFIDQAYPTCDANGNPTSNISASSEDMAIRKGRFSVLESAEATRDGESPLPTTASTESGTTAAMGSVSTLAVETIGSVAGTAMRSGSVSAACTAMGPIAESPVGISIFSGKDLHGMCSMEEEGRRSRFQVVHEDTTGTKVEQTLRGSPSIAAGRFQVSGEREPTAEGRDSTADIFPHENNTNNSNNHNLHSDSLSQPQPIQGSTLTRDASYLYEPEYTGEMTGSLIFVHPAQLDQLLLLNELVRQQLLELRNSAPTRGLTRSGITDGFYQSATSFDTFHNPSHSHSHPHPHPNHHSHPHQLAPHSSHTHTQSHGHGHNDPCSYLHDPVYNTSTHGYNHLYPVSFASAPSFPHHQATPLMEDPCITAAPTLSAYSAIFRDSPGGPLRGMARTVDNNKRRSMSIDQRIAMPPHPLSIAHTTATAGAPSSSSSSSTHPPPYTSASAVAHNAHHRTVHSLRSPILSHDYHGMLRELESLRKENEQLRRRPL